MILHKMPVLAVNSKMDVLPTSVAASKGKLFCASMDIISALQNRTKHGRYWPHTSMVCANVRPNGTFRLYADHHKRNRSLLGLLPRTTAFVPARASCELIQAALTARERARSARNKLHLRRVRMAHRERCGDDVMEKTLSTAFLSSRDR